MERTTQLDQERNPVRSNLDPAEKNLRITLLVMLALFVVSTPVALWQLDFVSPWKAVWLAFLGSNLAVWTAVVLIAAGRALASAFLTRRVASATSEVPQAPRAPHHAVAQAA